MSKIHQDYCEDCGCPKDICCKKKTAEKIFRELLVLPFSSPNDIYYSIPYEDKEDRMNNEKWLNIYQIKELKSSFLKESEGKK